MKYLREPQKVEKVRVYWNLHKKLWSVQSKGRVIAHLEELGLLDVSWVVRPAGRARVLREGKKNVHAFAVGKFAGFQGLAEGIPAYEREVRYNPFKAGHFVDEKGQKMKKSALAFFNPSRKVFYVES